jgi:hypothetical protein
VLGQNPLGFCMVSGEGTANPKIWATDWNKGPVRGAIPNGFVSPGNGNRPQWMGDWNSEEYWKPHNAMLLALMAELESHSLGDPFAASTNARTQLSPKELDDRINRYVNHYLVVPSAAAVPSGDEEWILQRGTMPDARMSFTDGKNGKAVRLDYSGNQAGAWAQLEINVDGKIDRDSVLGIAMKASPDTNAVLELKVVDEDGSTFWTRKDLSTLPTEWQELKFDLRQFAYGWGGDKKLDVIKTLTVAVSLKSASKGFVAVDEVWKCPRQ